MKEHIWKYIELKNQRILNFIGIYIASGSIFGLFLTIQMFQFEPISVLLLGILMCIIFIFSIFSSYLLLKKKDLGLDLMKAVMAIQVVGLKAIGYKYFFYIGLALGFQYNWDEEGVLGLLFNLSVANFSLSLQLDEYADVGFFINFIPIIVIRYILKIQNKAEENKILTNEI